MRIVIDMQGAQTTGSRHRGIGRYTLSLAKSLARNRGEHDVVLALNGLFPDSIETIRSAFCNLIPESSIRVWDAPGPASYMDEANGWRRRTGELVREAFVASLRPDTVILTSLFEGLDDDGVTSLALLGRICPTAVVLYDLIPLLYRSQYLDSPLVEGWYEAKLGHMRRADLLLAISESSRQEAINHLGVPSDCVVNISSAAEPRFASVRLDRSAEKTIRDRFHLDRPFVMYTGGIDHRKNIEGLIRAYANLPPAVRLAHQLAVVCSVTEEARIKLESLARAYGLGADELMLTGYVPDEDLLALYNLCKVFVFPSWHEGFGLPALEAMSCGKAVIAANTSSLPEVIGNEDALFDPRDVGAISDKLLRVLTDDDFRVELERHGLDQSKKFSWEKTARHAIDALEAIHASISSREGAKSYPVRRDRLAYISPLPPERSGISDYSAQLLPALSRYYDITVIVTQRNIAGQAISANCSVRSLEWFRENAYLFDRVVYHFGNSSFHQHMFEMLDEFPGIVVLHDFFLSGVARYLECTGVSDGFWSRELYHAHGYLALAQRLRAPDESAADEIVWNYPVNRSVLERARGVIVHSQYACRLADRWYGHKSSAEWAVVPLVRTSTFDASREDARRLLRLGPKDFVVCSFGMLGPTKLNHRLLDAWLDSPLVTDRNCFLVFVGEINEGEYGAKLVQTIRESSGADRISVTGWVDTTRYRQYLVAADAGVQLRARSRGETSAAVLDCMIHGLPTIINANGSMADLPDDALLKLDDQFEGSALTAALVELWANPRERRRLGNNAREATRDTHGASSCASAYYTSIERIHKKGHADLIGLSDAIARVDPRGNSKSDLVSLADSIGRCIAQAVRVRQLLVDVTGLVNSDLPTEVGYVVRRLLKEWLETPWVNVRVEPVYAPAVRRYHYARRCALDLLELPLGVLDDAPVEYAVGDVFFGFGVSPRTAILQEPLFAEMHRSGVKVVFAVYDLDYQSRPQSSSPVSEGDAEFLDVLSRYDGAVCASDAIARNLRERINRDSEASLRRPSIDVLRIGRDREAPPSTTGAPTERTSVLGCLSARPSFLVDASVDARNAEVMVVDAFDLLWQGDVDANLVIVSAKDAMLDGFCKRVRGHTELGKRLFLIETVTAEYLEQLYLASACVIVASPGERFGLPLIEASKYGRPLIAPDTAVFRDVAGEHAFYFSGASPAAFAEALRHWLRLSAEDSAPSSAKIQWPSWPESAHDLLDLLMPEERT